MDANRTEKCYGNCLKQINCISNDYYRDKECSENCQPIKCPNFRLCSNASPQWVLFCHGGRCGNCNICFGCNLTFTDKAEECVVCMEDKTTFIKWQCQHDLCVDCFRENHGWGKRNHELFIRDPKIYTLEEYNIIRAEEAKLEKSEEDNIEAESSDKRPEYIGKCPICRNEGIPDWHRKLLEKK